MTEFVQKCNTCKVAFPSIDEIKEHYRSEWHVFNSKRRSNNLISITEKDYNMINSKGLIKKKVMTKEMIENRTPRTEKKKINELNIDDTKIRDEVKNLAIEIIGKDNNNIDNIVTLAIEKSKNKQNHEIEAEDANDDDDDEVEDEEEVDSSNIPPTLPIGPLISIFDNHESETLDENLSYMQNKFGLFIPDIEYLTDKEGLVVYLNEKVKLGGICLYCQKQLYPGKSCQQHMISKSHCKIAYEEDIDLDEFEDFYDFTSSYNEFGIDNDEDIERQPQLKFNDIGELVLLNGKNVGHRAYRKYYKQYRKPVESRESVIAAQREEILKLTGQVSGIYTKQTSSDLVKLSDTDVMGLLSKYHKIIRKNHVIQQRAQKRSEFIAQRREYRSKVDKARSSATTTEKIRDYHGMLM